MITIELLTGCGQRISTFHMFILMSFYITVESPLFQGQVFPVTLEKLCILNWSVWIFSCTFYLFLPSITLFPYNKLLKMS